MNPSPVANLRLRITEGSTGQIQEHTHCGPVIQVGRGPGNDLTFADPRVSSMHGRFIVQDDQVRYQDLGSTNGSALIRDGHKRTVTQKDQAGIDLLPGDEIQLGDADRPSSVVFLEQMAQASCPETPPDATVVAKRALGEARGLSGGEAFTGLLQLLARLRTEDDPDSLTRQVLDFCLKVLPGAWRAECSFKAPDGSFVPSQTRGDDKDSGHMRTPSATLLHRMEQSQEALLVEDIQELANPSASMLSMPIRSLILAPLVVDQLVVGALQVGAREGGRFSERDLDLVAVLAQQLSAVLSGSKTIESLRRDQARLRDECEHLRERFAQQPALDEMIGNSKQLLELKSNLKKVAPNRTTVLIQGETGSGKELVARAIHENSPRSQEPFAAVNCSALAAGLLQSELFGHVRGAFTGAHRDRQGLFQVAHGGTLFLDEVGDMPAELQPKFLRVLEEGLVTPVGSNEPRAVDVRVVCATHRDLDQEVGAGRFRQDLLFRINVFRLDIPPLRQRGDDILALARHFLDIFSREHGRPVPEITAQAQAALQAYHWPGNVRELRNEIERGSLLAREGQALDLADLSDRLGGSEERLLPTQGTLKEILLRLEATVLKTALQQHGGNRTHCAKALGISRQALIAKIARLGVEED